MGQYRRHSRGTRGSSSWVVATWLFVGCAQPTESRAVDPVATRGSVGLGTLTAAVGRANDAVEVGSAESALRPEALRSCKNVCKVEAACGYILEPVCTELCEVSEPVLEANACSELAAAENDCLSSMSCGELRRYGEEGRRLNEKCGAPARAFFDACTLGKGMLPKPCTDLCMHYLECELLEVTLPACEETCVGNATGFRWQKGDGCSSAFLDYVSCVASASCEEASLLVDGRVSPPSCAMALGTFDAQCQ